jgi:hypothetical protein
MCRVAGADVAGAPFTKKGRWQMAEGRRKEVIRKTLVVGLKPTLKKYLF